MSSWKRGAGAGAESAACPRSLRQCARSKRPRSDFDLCVLIFALQPRPSRQVRGLRSVARQSWERGLLGAWPVSLGPCATGKETQTSTNPGLGIICQ